MNLNSTEWTRTRTHLKMIIEHCYLQIVLKQEI